MPRLDLVKKELIPIEGNPPDPRELPPGCAFAPRCSRALEKCRRNSPAMTPAPEWPDDPDYHRFACYNPFKPHEGRTQASSQAKAGAQIGQGDSENMGGAP